MGVIHGLAGSAAVALLVLTTIREPRWAVLYLLVFGAGTIAGMMPVPYPGMTPHWGTYFTVKDTDETARVAQELGGELFVPPMDIPGIGRFSGILSPQGVRFFAIQYLPRQAL